MPLTSEAADEPSAIKRRRATRTEVERRRRDLLAQSVEVDAVEPDRLPRRVEDAIARHLPPHEFAVLHVAEESEGSHLHRLVTGLAR